MINKKNDVGLILFRKSNKYTNLDSVNQSWIENIKKFIVYNLKGVRTDTFDYRHFWTKRSIPSNVDLHEQLVGCFKKNFHQSAFSLLKYSDSKATRYFIEYFEKFYLKVLPRFFQAIDYYYKKYDKREIVGSLVEFIHPLKFHILSNLKKPSICISPNFFLHNQYLSPYLINRLGSYYQTVAVSKYDKSRYNRLGYKDEQVAVVDPGNFKDVRNKLKPYKTIKTITGANVLIIPPWIDLLHHFRHLINSRDLIHYFSDILDILDNLRIKSVKIRMHPESHSYLMNATNYTAADCYKYFVEMGLRKRGKPYTFDFCYSDSSHSNFSADVQNSDLVIGPISGSLFDTLLLGRDYVVYDNSVSPFPGIIESNLIDDEIIKRNKCIEELTEHLKNYSPINRDHIFNTYYPDIFLNDVKKNNEDKNIFQLLNLSKQRN